VLVGEDAGEGGALAEPPARSLSTQPGFLRHPEGHRTVVPKPPSPAVPGPRAPPAVPTAMLAGQDVWLHASSSWRWRRKNNQRRKDFQLLGEQNSTPPPEKNIDIRIEGTRRIYQQSQKIPANQGLEGSADRARRFPASARPDAKKLPLLRQLLPEEIPTSYLGFPPPPSWTRLYLGREKRFLSLGKGFCSPGCGAEGGHGCFCLKGGSSGRPKRRIWEEIHRGGWEREPSRVPEDTLPVPRPKRGSQHFHGCLSVPHPGVGTSSQPAWDSLAPGGSGTPRRDALPSHQQRFEAQRRRESGEVGPHPPPCLSWNAAPALYEAEGSLPGGGCGVEEHLGAGWGSSLPFPTVGWGTWVSPKISDRPRSRRTRSSGNGLGVRTQNGAGDSRDPHRGPAPGSAAWSCAGQLRSGTSANSGHAASPHDLPVWHRLSPGWGGAAAAPPSSGSLESGISAPSRAEGKEKALPEVAPPGIGSLRGGKNPGGVHSRDCQPQRLPLAPGAVPTELRGG